MVVAIAAADVWLNLWDDSPFAVTVAAAGCSALALRRRFPLAVFVWTLPATLMQDMLFAPFAALFTLAERSRNRRLLVVCALLFALASAAPWPLDDLSSRDRTWTWSTSSTCSPPPPPRCCWANCCRPAGIGPSPHGDRGGPRT